MNWAHAHLILNHFPVIGIVVAVTLLTVVVVRRHRGLQRASLIAFIAVGVLAIPVYFTGEPAEELLESMAGISEEFIEHHEDAALKAFIGLETLAIAALVGLLLLRRRGAVPGWFTPGLWVLSILVGAGTVWTAELGGRIRHTEIRPASSADASAAEMDEDREHGDERNDTR